jgi:hypothetical protein
VSGGAEGWAAGAAVQHVNIKIFAKAPAPQDLTPALAVFHRWIQQGAFEELLIDVADYRHVPAGPGVILIGHEANYSLDLRAGRLGLLYNRKAPVAGGAAENVAQALKAALAACRRLEGEPELEDRLAFDRGEFEITINDRGIAPNTDEAFARLRPAIERGIGLAMCPGAPLAVVVLERAGEARERLRVAAHRR